MMYGIHDPLEKVRKEQSETARNVCPLVKDHALNNDDPLCEAGKFSIAGNSIDIMKAGTKTPTKEILNRIKQCTLESQYLDFLKERIQKTKNWYISAMIEV